jgi:serine/threonine protein kinase
LELTGSVFLLAEVMMGQAYDYKADVFSFGIILFEIITRSKPFKRFPKDNFYFMGDELLSKIQQLSAASPPPEPIQMLCIRATAMEPEKRPAFKQISTEIINFQKEYELKQMSQM